MDPWGHSHEKFKFCQIEREIFFNKHRPKKWNQRKICGLFLVRCVCICSVCVGCVWRVWVRSQKWETSRMSKNTCLENGRIFCNIYLCLCTRYFFTSKLRYPYLVEIFRNWPPIAFKKKLSKFFVSQAAPTFSISVSSLSRSLPLRLLTFFFTVYLFFFFLNKIIFKCDTKESLMNNGECVGQDEAERAWRWECRKLCVWRRFCLGACFFLIIWF